MASRRPFISFLSKAKNVTSWETCSGMAKTQLLGLVASAEARKLDREVVGRTASTS